jgi:hypothetical protein
MLDIKQCKPEFGLFCDLFLETIVLECLADRQVTFHSCQLNVALISRPIEPYRNVQMGNLAGPRKLEIFRKALPNRPYITCHLAFAAHACGSPGRFPETWYIQPH